MMDMGCSLYKQGWLNFDARRHNNAEKGGKMVTVKKY